MQQDNNYLKQKIKSISKFVIDPNEFDLPTEFLGKKIKKNPIKPVIDHILCPPIDNNKLSEKEEEIDLNELELQQVRENEEKNLQLQEYEKEKEKLKKQREQQEILELQRLEEERLEKERLRQEKLNKLPEEAKDVGDFSSVDEGEKEQLSKFQIQQMVILDEKCVMLDDDIKDNFNCNTNLNDKQTIEQFPQEEIIPNIGNFSNETKKQNGCFRCGQQGHFSRECPEQAPKRTCRNCGEEGHFARECPNKSNKICRNCGKEGHIARECPEPRKLICHNCGKEGHFAKDCIEPKKTKICFKCGSLGHFTKDCLNRDRVIPVSQEAEEGEMGEI